MRKICLVSSTIQTLLSVPELHRFSPAKAGVANYHRRSGNACFWHTHPAPKKLNFICKNDVLLPAKVLFFK